MKNYLTNILIFIILYGTQAAVLPDTSPHLIDSINKLLANPNPNPSPNSTADILKNAVILKQESIPAPTKSSALDLSTTSGVVHTSMATALVGRQDSFVQLHGPGGESNDEALKKANVDDRVADAHTPLSTTPKSRNEASSPIDQPPSNVLAPVDQRKPDLDLVNQKAPSINSNPPTNDQVPISPDNTVLFNALQVEQPNTLDSEKSPSTASLASAIAHHSDAGSNAVGSLDLARPHQHKTHGSDIDDSMMISPNGLFPEGDGSAQRSRSTTARSPFTEESTETTSRSNPVPYIVIISIGCVLVVGVVGVALYGFKANQKDQKDHDTADSPPKLDQISKPSRRRASHTQSVSSSHAGTLFDLERPESVYIPSALQRDLFRHDSQGTNSFSLWIINNHLVFWSDEYMENMTEGFESLDHASVYTIDSEDSEDVKPLSHYKDIKNLLNGLPDPTTAF